MTVDNRQSDSPGLVNAMTVDVEDYFQVAAFESHVDRARWHEMPCRVEANTDRILDLFQNHGIQATFFVLVWVADRYPQLIRRILSAGHELASHGMSHIRVTQQTPAEFLADATESRKRLEDIGGTPVTGYRASTYSIGSGNLWAFDILEEAGYHYSSSIYPIQHDLYGMPAASRFPFHPRRGMKVGREGILEIPITTLHLLGRRIPCGGGGFFRLYPYRFSRWAWNHFNRQENRPGVFYFHPWELDPQQPRVAGIPLRTRFRHYLNLTRMEGKLSALLRDFQWDRMDRVFQNAIREARVHDRP